jgi:uncharacterized protein (TIGR03437 family)
MDPDLRQTLAATYLGGGYPASIASLTVDGWGNLFVGGSTAPRGLPTIAPLAQAFGSPTTGFGAVLSGDLSAIRFSGYFGDSDTFLLQSVAAGANGSLVLGGVTATPNVTPSPGAVWVNSVAWVPPPRLRIDSVVNAASRLDDPISGGETIVVRGEGFGRDAVLRVGGEPVSPISSTSREITAIVPRDVRDTSAAIEVESGGELSNTVTVPVSVTSPGLFSLDRSGVGQGYIVNEGGSLNGRDHPAHPGERITIFATGIGPVTFDQGYAVTASPVAVFIEIFYARGVAAVMRAFEGFPGEVYQLTVYVPTYEELVAANPDLATFRYPPQVGVVLTVAGRSSQNGLAISIAP